MMRARVFRQLVVLLCAVGTAIGFAGSARSIASAAVPTESNPALVRVGLQIHNLAGVDEVKERWEVAGTIITSWRDPSLTYRPHNPGDRDRDVAKSTWRPVLVFRNEVEQSRFSNPDIYVEPNGTVTYTQDFNAVLSTELDLRRFPFDSESLPIVVEPAGEDAERVVLQFDPKLSAVPKARYAELAQWKTIALTAHPDTESLANRSTRGIGFTLQIRRNSRPYVWKFIIPLILLVMISWVTFWLSHDEFTTKDQLSAAIATLLIIVAYNLVASNQLPKTNYITYIDALLFTSFVFVIIAIGFIVAIHLQRMSPPRALQLRRFAGIALPVSFLVTQVLLVMSFRI
jgi:Neurotransmitter-gated ion-channel ligand binding domain/Neurotransmitter-gated ion-channel transmembrane region